MGTNTIKFLTIALLFLGTCKAASVFILYGQDALNDIDSKIGQLNDEDYFTYHLGQMNKENSKTTNFNEKNKMDDVELIKADQFVDSSAENHISDNWNQIFDKKNNEEDLFQLSKNVDKNVEMLPDNFELEKKKTDLINEIDTEVNKNDQLYKNLFQLSKPFQHVYRVGPYEIQMEISVYGGILNLNDNENTNANEININRLFNEMGSIPDPVIDQFNPEIYEEKKVTYEFDPEIYGGNTDRNEDNTETYQIDSEINEDNTEKYDNDKVDWRQQLDRIFGRIHNFEVDPEINEDNTETYEGYTETNQFDPEFNEDNKENYDSDEVEIFGSTTEQQYEVDPEINGENTETYQFDPEVYGGGNTETYEGNTETYQFDKEINEDKTENYGSDEVEIFEGTTEPQYEVIPEINGGNTANYDSDEVEINGGNTEKYQFDPEVYGGNTETYQYSNTDRYENNFEETNKFEPVTHKSISQDDIDLYNALEDIRKYQIHRFIHLDKYDKDLRNTDLGNIDLGNTDLNHEYSDDEYMDFF